MTMAHLQYAMRDDRVANAAAVVRIPADGGEHWEVINDQLLIHCVGKNSQTPFWAHACGTRLGRGVWNIPDPGTEVLIGFDDGDSEGDAFLIGIFGRSVPGDLDTTTTIIQDTKIVARGMVVLGDTTDTENVATETDLSNLAGLLRDSTVLTALATYISSVVASSPDPGPFAAAIATYFGDHPIPGTSAVIAKRS